MSLYFDDHDWTWECEIHQVLVPQGSDCHICSDLESQPDPEDLDLPPACVQCGGPGYYLARTKSYSTAMQRVCVRCYIDLDPISGHHPDCQCDRCYYGDDAYLARFHPGEY